MSELNDHFIEFENLEIRFRDSRSPASVQNIAIKGISLTIDRSEFLSIVGPSGCGKSTLLNALSGLLWKGGYDIATKGRIMVGGSQEFPDVNAEQDHLTKRMGFVFQNPTLLEWRTVLQNIQLPGEVLHDREMIARSAEFSELVQLSDSNHKYPRELSGGMKSRVSIARALVQKPEILLMDECFGSLDEITRDELHIELMRIWQFLKPTIVFVTHNVQEAVYLSQRVAVMSSSPGTIQEIIEVPFGYPRSFELKEDMNFVSKVGQVRRCLQIGKRT